jgi:4-amino-4-deoxy-L-arabinose transferase-like glycosyltransferase
MPNTTTAMALFVLAAGIRIGYAVACYLYLGPDGLMGPDSYAFLLDAQRLADGGSVLQLTSADQQGFSINIMPAAFLIMSWTLTPGVAPDPLGYVLVQSMLDAGTCLLIGYLAQRIVSGTFVIAALLAALNPTQIVVAGMVYTDTPFLFFVTAAFALTLIWFSDATIRSALGAGVMWGLALMTRPFVQHWLLVLPVLLVFALMVMRNANWQKRVVHLAVMAFLVIAISAPIALRNQDEFGTLRLHSQTGSHLLFWVTPLVREFQDGTPRAVSKARGDTLFEKWGDTPPSNNPFERSDRMVEIAKQELTDLGPAAVAAAWTKGAVMNLAAPAATIATPVSSLPRIGFYDTKGDNLTEKIWNYLFSNEGSAYAAILLASGVSMPVWGLLGIAGAGIAVFRIPGATIPAVLFILWAGYVLALNGPVVSPKYRLPLEPVWIVFAAISLQSLRRRFDRSI